MHLTINKIAKTKDCIGKYTIVLLLIILISSTSIRLMDTEVGVTVFLRHRADSLNKNERWLYSQTVVKVKGVEGVGTWVKFSLSIK